MENHGKRWDALPSRPWETLGWAKEPLRTKSWRNATIWSKCLKSIKVCTMQLSDSMEVIMPDKLFWRTKNKTSIIIISLYWCVISCRRGLLFFTSLHSLCSNHHSFLFYIIVANQVIVRLVLVVQDCAFLVVFNNNSLNNFISSRCHFTGKPFDTASPVNYATSNVISSIVYGSRFEYSDPRFKNMVRRANESIRIAGSPPIQVNFIFTWIWYFI